MDRNAVIGFVLIGLVLMLWMWLNAPPPQPQKSATTTDSIAIRKSTMDSVRAVPPAQEKKYAATDTLGKYFAGLATGKEKFLYIESDLYRARISSKGGSIQVWELKKFKTWNQYPVNLINNDSAGDFHLLFSSADGKLVDTKNLYFESPLDDNQTVTLANQDSFKVDFVLKISEQSRIVKTLVFHNGDYDFDAYYRFEGMDGILANFEYQATWESGLRYAESNSIDESNSAKAFAYAGGEMTEVDATKFNETQKQNISGRVNWVATRIKYFAVAIINREGETQGAYLEGNRQKEPDNGAKEDYSLALKMPFLGNKLETAHFTVYLGPLDFDIVKSYNAGLDQMMSLGAAWIIRPISEYVMIPLFKFLKLFIPNYGFVLIVFSIIIKLALQPLTATSMKSMQRMQQLQPMMTEIRAKFKDDPQKQNQQIMRLYKEYGVNPAGGCLPMLLQLPILYALWAVFRSSIDLRQASFIWWIKDLSVPDVITKLSFRLPIANMDEISGLALLMGITMFVQQKMSVKDPRQKAMVWMMPVMMTLLFNSFPAGLNLYYFVFNLLSIGQQAWITKKHKDEPLRKVEEKKKSGGIFARLTKDMPRLNR